MSLLAATLGCGAGQDVQFQPNRVAIIENDVCSEHALQIASVLEEVFGTPDAPRVPHQVADLLHEEPLGQAAGVVRSEEEGEQSLGLYRRHCALCHGIAGDGQGPAALYQFPYPRELRDGVFKYKSTYRNEPPTDQDLTAMLRDGMPGVAMPSFGLLPDEEIAALVNYVKYLAMRGQLERELVRYAGQTFDYDPATGEPATGSGLDWQRAETQDLVLEQLLPPIALSWREANAKQVPTDGGPPDSLDSSPAWIAEGQRLFHDAQRANCVKCHGREGQGGVVLEEDDEWNKHRRDFLLATDRLRANSESLQDRMAREGQAELLAENLNANLRELARRSEVERAWLPPRAAVARRLQNGVLRGGASPEDLFRRVHQGIAGTPMPGVGGATPDGQGALSDEEIWKIVAYVQSLIAE